LGVGPRFSVSPVICPYCSANDDKVIDSRSSEGGRVIRRRRQCLKCDKRFTTYERVEQTQRLVVIKRDGSHVPFSRENILRGVQAACGKRNIPEEVKERLVDEVEEELHRDFDREVDSITIGQRVMARLRNLDEVAYIRFASEYLKLGSAGELMAEINELKSHPRDVKEQQSLF
jgi:transcriptional repressor NrdR